MSVNEIQALAQKFADAFDRDIKTVLDMLSDDVEVFDTVPYRFDGRPLFAKFLNEAFEGIASTSFGFRQPSCRVYNDFVGIVNAYDMFTYCVKDDLGQVSNADCVVLHRQSPTCQTAWRRELNSVSYTHLTLPTICSV